MTTVRPGQIWQDKRTTTRLLRIEHTGDTHAVVQPVAITPQGTIVRIPLRPSRIRLDRFKPTNTGFWLVRDCRERRVAKPRQQPPRRGDRLDPDEVAVLALVAQGTPNTAIARKLGLTAHGVRRRLHVAFVKLGAVDRASAVYLAREQITAQEATR